MRWQGPINFTEPPASLGGHGPIKWTLLTGCARSGDVPVSKTEEMIIGGARSKREGAGPELFWIERCLLNGLLDCPWFGTCREVPQDVGKNEKNLGTRSTNTGVAVPFRPKPTHEANACQRQKRKAHRAA